MAGIGAALEGVVGDDGGATWSSIGSVGDGVAAAGEVGTAGGEARRAGAAELASTAGASKARSDGEGASASVEASRC